MYASGCAGADACACVCVCVCVRACVCVCARARACGDGGVWVVAVGGWVQMPLYAPDGEDGREIS